MQDYTLEANQLFDNVVVEYHKTDNVDTPINNPYEKETFNHLLYQKCWIDTVQWHLEDIIRDPSINPTEALKIKRRIDKSNQDRTDIVEQIDDYFIEKFKNVTIAPNATLNTETPAWAFDRLSILALKLYHMKEQMQRTDAPEQQIIKCTQKYNTLKEQRIDLSTSINQLLDDMQNGKKQMKVYRQMKMYNDPDLNPVLYAKKQ